jgi:hypothetical protein
MGISVGGIRTLANMLAAKEEGASMHPSKEVTKPGFDVLGVRLSWRI